MGNRAVITTEENFQTQTGLGVYNHWNGGADSVQGPDHGLHFDAFILRL